MAQLPEITPVFCEQLWQKVCNWGRWGASDQLGALNLVTTDVRQAAAKLVSEGHVISLGNVWPVDPGPHNPWPAEHRMLRAGDDCDYPGVPGLSVALDYIGIQHHGVACSHIDALCHVFVKHQMYNGYPATDVKSTGATRNDMTPMFDGVVTRGVLLDIPRLHGTPYLTGDVRIGVDDLLAAEREQGVMVSSGDLLIVHKGREQRLLAEGPIDPNADGMPGLHAECVEFLHERGVVVLGSDYMHDPQPNWVCEDWPLPIHYLGICGMGMTLIHNMDTRELAQYCQQSKRSAFLVTVAPLKVVGGTGSPVNPIAMF
ncbi:MAG: cyclase family protein [Pseudomonadales bacterium]